MTLRVAPRSRSHSLSSSPSSSNVAADLRQRKSHTSSRAKALPMTSIPDMRFEQSFLASVRTFIHEVDTADASRMKEARHRNEGARRAGKYVASTVDDEVRLAGTDAQGTRQDDAAPPAVMKSKSPHGEPELWLGRLRIEWWPLLYLTIRDQLFSPIVQGAVFGLGGLALSSIRTFVVARQQH